MAKLSKKTLDGNVETLLLAVLRDGPSYGYQIVTDLNERGAGLLQMGEGTIYPVLHRMEERGLIEATWRTGETGRQRKYYRLTPKGRRAFVENQAQWHGLVSVMSAIFGPKDNSSESVKGVTS